MRRLLIALALLVFASSASAETYWVSPTGAATWANCDGATPLDGAAACSLTTMRTNQSSLVAGDTVYFRDSTYTYNDAATLITPSASGTVSGGTCTATITYSAYAAEVPLIDYTNASTAIYPASLIGRDCIVIRGIRFKDFPRPINIANGSDYVEIDSNWVYRTVAGPTVGIGIHVRNGDSGGLAASTHAWIHDNVVFGWWLAPCGEGGDGISIGQTGDNEDSNNATVEGNTIYNVGHTGTENFTRFNVWRNNFIYNPGFKTFTANLTGTATGGSTTTMIDTTKDFSALGVRTGTFLYVHDLDDPGGGDAQLALVASITTTTNPNDTLTYTATAATPTFANGHDYSIGCAYFADANPPGDGKYGHRAMHVDTQSGQRAAAFEDRILIEGNRSGHAASNPGNDGAEGLVISAGYTIVRYNELFGSAGPGLYFKNGIVSSFNKVYNNTIAGNGLFSATQNAGNPLTLTCVQVTSTTTFNVLKNNICYDNTDGDFNESLPASYTQTSNHLAAQGDPLFDNYDLTDYDSTTLPDLDLRAGSPALNAGTHLTVAVGAGVSTTTLIVDDAGYFQDGTWGSSLSDIQPDCIAVGTVSNTVCISSVTPINYATHTITLASAMSWSDGASVWLYKKSDGAVVLYGAAPDLGANEYELSASGPIRLRRSPN
jgi:hypothetical protein